MARPHSVIRGATQASSCAPNSPTRQHRLPFILAAVGALSFWLPDVAIHIDAGPTMDSKHAWAVTILAPLTFLFAYVVARKFALKRDFKCAGPAMLLAVWFTGGLFMALAAAASHGDFVGVHGGWQVVIILLSVVPVVTYILAANDGSLVALLAVTVGAVLIWGIRACWALWTSSTAQDESTSADSATHQVSKVA